mgnify:CR=1 FL=1|jgi:hypothetical protein
MKCPKCSYKNIDNKYYCAKCGAALYDQNNFDDCYKASLSIDAAEEKIGVIRLAKIGCGFGALVGILMALAGSAGLQLHQLVVVLVLYVLLGAIWGLGYAFGLHYLRSLLSFFFGVSSIWAIWEYFKENSFLIGVVKVVFIYFFFGVLGLSIVWIPGIFRGIYKIYKVRNANV